MSDKNQHLTYRGQDDNDEGCDILYSKCLREENPRVDFTVSSEINKELLEKETWKWKKHISKSPSVELASATASGSGIIGMIDTFDRPTDTNLEGTYTRAGSYVEGFGLGGAELKILGSGVSIGPKISVSLLGSELSFSL